MLPIHDRALMKKPCSVFVIDRANYCTFNCKPHNHGIRIRIRNTYWPEGICLVHDYHELVAPAQRQIIIHVKPQ